MQRIIKNTIIFTLLYFLTSCSKDFLDQGLTPVSFPIGLSNIYVSPNWQSADYQFKLPAIKDADYEILSKPSWLNIASVSGQLSDSIAIVQCSATRNSSFDAVGVYTDFMTVRANNIDYKVPVAYITEGNPSIQVQSSLTLSYSPYGYISLPIQNIGAGILIWQITSMPDWLTLDISHLDINGLYISQNNWYDIPFLVKTDMASSGTLTGKIVLSTNDSEHPSVTIDVTIDMGTPELYTYGDMIDFSSDETSKTFYFGNFGDGILVWEFQDIPEWLTIEPSKGVYSSYNSSDIIFTCDRTKLQPGQNVAVVTLKSNDSSRPSYNITVTAVTPGDNTNNRAIVGTVVDAVFNRNTNTLYYVTTSPSKLIAYDVNTRTVLNEIALSKAPTCLAITEDWTKAAVGHNGYISAINLSNYTVTTTYTVDYSVYDIAWGENDWFSYTQKDGSSCGLHWINTTDGTLYDDTDHSLYGSAIIKKVPGQPYIIATRTSVSPSGFFAYDIATKSKKSYAHMSLTNFWFSQNGDYVFSKFLDVYRTTSSTGSDDTFNATINSIATINTGSETYYGAEYIYHGNNNLWVIKNDSYSSDESSSLYQVEDNDYTLVKKIFYDVLYQPDGQTNSFYLRANYVFANNNGTEITVLSKGLTNDSWVMQFIAVN